MVQLSRSPPFLVGLVCIQDEVRLKNRLKRQWQVTRDPTLKARVNCLQRSVTYRLNEWRNDQWSNTLESLDSEDQSLRKMTKWCEFPLLRPPPPASAGRTSSVRL
jgi:hypothetical protein